MGSECIPRHASAMTAGIGERTTINRRLLPYGSSFFVGKANHLPCIEDSLHLSAGSFNFLLTKFQGEDIIEVVIEDPLLPLTGAMGGPVSVRRTGRHSRQLI